MSALRHGIVIVPFHSGLEVLQEQTLSAEGRCQMGHADRHLPADDEDQLL
jgi:hypothetical protein